MVGLLATFQRKRDPKICDRILDLTCYVPISLETMNSLIWQQKYMPVLIHYGALEKETEIKMMYMLF